MKRLGVTHIVNVAVELLAMWPDEFSYKIVPNLKETRTSLLQEMNNLMDFMNDAHSQGGIILVSWFYGENRSASVVLAYLMQRYGWTYDTAEAYLSDH